MGGGQEWTSQEALADINIVPLVDVLLVLLVIFMITAPIITHTLEVDLPKASLTPGANPNQTLIVSVDARGNLAVNDKLLGPFNRKSTRTRFQQEIGQWQARNPGAPAFLRADRRLVYGTVIQVMAQLRGLGIENVGLMIEREGG